MLIRTPWNSQPQGPVGAALEFQQAYLGNNGANYAASLPGVAGLGPAGLSSTIALGSGQTIAITPSITVGSSWTLLFVVRRDSAAGSFPYFLGISGAANAIAMALSHGSFAGRATAPRRKTVDLVQRLAKPALSG